MENNQENLNNLRHSCAHLLAAAVMQLWPKTKRTIGPAIENGFYYDFEFESPISESEFPKIEQKMHEIAKSWMDFKRSEVTPDQARAVFVENPYKLELIDEFSKEGKSLTLYQSGQYIDLCRGGHVEDPSHQLKYFKLLSLAGAYWRGDEHNIMLTRIYGTAFFTREELDAYLLALEESKKRDHKKLGKELELYTISSEVGPGLTLWLPNGAIIRREIENFMVSEQTKMGYQHVYSPHIGQKSLWEKSGHWQLYREKMYSPMDVEGVEYLAKPMTCPMHIQTFQFKPHSYRDLPFRIAEIASVYRYEQSGELNGLLRVRAFTQDDAHIFCTQEQAVDEFVTVFRFIQKLYAVFGFKDYRVRLGVRSTKEKYLGSDQMWESAQEKAIEALKKTKANYFIAEGDAAFYGPKADFLIKDALGREWQCGTVQIDFMLPERFQLSYVDSDGNFKTPVMVHRAPLGSLERFLAILTEQYAGCFPVWLSPVQVAVIPIGEEQHAVTAVITQKLLESGIRAQHWNENERMQNRIRKAEHQKIPYIIIVGKKEVENKTVSVRSRANKETVMTVGQLKRQIQKEIKNHQ